MDPEMELSDLPEYNKERIEGLEELVQLIQQRNLERERMYGVATNPAKESDPYAT